ncbi:RICIN domain-containing protein [Granulosicoccus sp.]|nr:ricin-type beta-trefoil lectin domain protein [Granulosicoccus sp.]MDB4224373.1 RICIN domain-containing protein [Granulosicoccus sp.]
MTKITSYTLATFTFFSTQLVHADNVEIYLTDMLDNTQSGYCIDIARAQGEKANPDDGLQGHTCYSPKGELMVDQIFDSEKFADGILYMPEFDVCAEITSVTAGSSIALATCNDSPEQSFLFSGTGTIVPTSAADLCMTVAEDTRTGRSKVNQIKVLSLEACSDDNASNQDWAVRSGL